MAIVPTPDETVRQSAEDRDHAQSLSREAPELEGYELEARLGEGAFGVVWSATQLRTGQRVALKILHPELHNWGYVQHELRKLRQISGHPFVVSLLDADLENSPPYFVMPLLLKGSLSQVKEPSQGQIETWLEQIAQALCFMHGKGLLHCDLKPSNVLLDEEGRCRVVDFGQARAQGEVSGAFGTLGFMPPEQTQAGSHPDTNWDIYGFGATAYRLLTGECPRLSDTDRSELTDTQTAEERLEGYRKLLGNRALVPLRKLNPKVDEDLAVIVESCLKLDPELRPDSMHQVQEDLERRKDKAPLLCQRPWSLRYRVNRFLARPLVVLLLCAAVLFPIFVNSYLTVHAQMALRTQALEEASSVNQVVARHLATDGVKSVRIKDFQHHLIADNQVVESSSPNPPSSVDLDKLSEEVGSPDRGFYDRDGIPMLGCWTRVGSKTLLSERPTEHVMAGARYLLKKNWLLNFVILLIAVLTVLALLKPRTLRR